MQDIQINHKWISANEYAKQTGLGVEKVKQFIAAGKIEGEKTKDGYWKVKVYDNDAVSREVFEKEHDLRIKAETKLKLLENIILERSN